MKWNINTSTARSKSPKIRVELSKVKLSLLSKWKEYWWHDDAVLQDLLEECPFLENQVIRPFTPLSEGFEKIFLTDNDRCIYFHEDTGYVFLITDLHGLQRTVKTAGKDSPVTLNDLIRLDSQSGKVVSPVETLAQHNGFA